MNTPQLKFEGFKTEWKSITFREITKINQGLQIPISDRFLEEGTGRYFYITNEFLKANSAKKYYIENPMISVQCNNEDILMTRTGNTGKVITNVSGAFHNNFFKIKYDKSQINKDFLFNLLNTRKIQKKILALAGQSTIPDLNHSDFYKIRTSIPSINEQERIGSFFYSLGVLIEKQQEKVELLNQQKKGLMQKIFSQELRFKDENGQAYPEWEHDYLNNLGTFGKSYSYSRAVEGNGVYRYIHYGDIHSIYSAVCENVEFPTIRNVQEYELLKDSDVVFADASEDYADLGKAILIKNVNKQQVIAGLHTHKFTPNERLKSLYFIYFTQTRIYEEFIKKMGTGVSVLGISKSNLSKLEVPLPSVHEQERIGNIIYLLDQKIQFEKSKIKTLKTQKQTLMQQMFI